MGRISRRNFLYMMSSSGVALTLFPISCKRKADSLEELIRQAKPTDLKVLLIGIDGATLDIIEPLAKAGRLSQFKQLMDIGTYAKLRSQKPMLSPSLWTTIATGHQRSRHNITYFFSRQDQKDKAPNLVSSNDRKTLALWNIVSEFKKDVFVDGWWVTWPAEPVHGKMVSDRLAQSRWSIWTNSQKTEYLTYPSEMLAEIKHMIVDPTNPPMNELQQLVDLTDAERSEMLNAKKPIFAHALSVSKFGYCAQRTYENIALHIFDHIQPDLSMIFLIAVDPICHTFWHYFHPEQFSGYIEPDKVPRFGKCIPAIYEHNDSYLAELLPKTNSNTVVIIVSDHGFQASGNLPRKTEVIDYRPLGIDHVEKIDQPVTVGMSGIHHIDGTFIASGGPIIKGAKYKEQPSIADITPTILALMGLPVGKDMAGRVLEEIISPKFLAAHPVQYIDSYENYIKREIIDASVKVGEDEQREYLRSLGYIK